MNFRTRAIYYIQARVLEELTSVETSRPSDEGVSLFYRVKRAVTRAKQYRVNFKPSEKLELL